MRDSCTSILLYFISRLILLPLCSDRRCPPPPPPPDPGGIVTGGTWGGKEEPGGLEEEEEVTYHYGSTVEYGCQTGMRFRRGGEGHWYDFQTTTCRWDQTWAPGGQVGTGELWHLGVRLKKSTR